MQLKWVKKQIRSMAFVCAMVLLAVGSGCPSVPNTDPPPAQTLDADGDGVSNANDLCENTPANTTVDTTGCLFIVPDADGDSVSDDDDRCIDTLAGEDVDSQGCAASQRDSDRDLVFDNVDECANTPTDAIIDDVGCPVTAGGPDTDGDGVNDDIDQCDNTSEGAEVDANGCAANERDTDMDGVFDDVDRCPNTPRGTTVDTTGCTQTLPPVGGGDPPGSVCGNDVLESGEQCDPPNGTTCDANCQTTTGGTLTNDSCMTPIAIEGDPNTGALDRSFSTIGATTDGPDETDAPAECSLGNYTHVESDIWYLYTTTCSNIVTVSLCGSLYDTKMMIYEGSGCPVDAIVPLACSDDDCGPGANARTIFTAVTGQQYMIRIGGFEGEQGDGTLTIYCGNDPNRGLAACGGGAGECFPSANPPNNTPGCDDVNACNRTCEVDPFCCDTAWDQTCADKADGIINGFAACSAGSTNVCKVEATSGVGCSDQACCQSVCEEDAFCCTTRWDGVCADRADVICP